MKMKNLTLNFNYYEFVIMYENETSPTLPFIFIYLLFFFFLKLCKHRSTSSKISINFFLQQFKLLIQKVICRTSRFGRNSVLAEILFAQ